MQTQCSKILLTGLEFFGRHGALASEAELGGRFVVDAELLYPFGELADQLTDAVNYAEAYTTIKKQVCEQRYQLIEVLARQIAHDLLASQPKLQGVTVRVHKPFAPIEGIFRDVCAEINMGREDI